jgi:beta-barrel assembly-enhancing protease
VASPRESEVMSVLAHEIGHVTQRHIARMFGQQRQSSAVMIAAALLAAIAAQSSPDAAMGLLSLGQTVAIRDQLSFSRDAEREADRVGLQILSVSGFDPAGMSSMFERLGQAGRLYDNNAPAYLRTHPLSTERVADIQNRLQTDPDLRRLQKNAAGHSGMQAGLKSAGGPESVQFSWLRAKLIALTDTKVDGLRAARTRFEAQLNDPTQNTAGHQGPIQFGIAWAALLQRDFKGALAAIEAAKSLAESAGVAQEISPLLIHLKLQLAIAANQEPAAKALVQMVQNSQVLANERAVARASIEAQLAFGMPAETTAAMARKASQQWPQDPQVWNLLGRAEAARGRLAAKHAAVAEQYAISGAYAAAVEQLTLARAAGDADFITLSKIDARLTAMRAALRREQIERQQQNR